MSSKIPSYYQDDSDGKYKGVDYDNIKILVFAGLVCFGLFFWRWTASSLADGCMTGGIPLSLILGWVFGLRHNKPKAYDVDFFQSLKTKNWERDPKQKIAHPFIEELEVKK
jgi:hypothetical protein